MALRLWCSHQWCATIVEKTIQFSSVMNFFECLFEIAVYDFAIWSYVSIVSQPYTAQVLSYAEPAHANVAQLKNITTVLCASIRWNNLLWTEIKSFIVTYCILCKRMLEQQNNKPRRHFYYIPFTVTRVINYEVHLKDCIVTLD